MPVMDDLVARLNMTGSRLEHALPETGQEFREAMNVKRFGAVGDGVTDDSAAFTAALAQLSTEGGGELFVPKGNYLINAVLASTTVRIVGEGMFASNLYISGTTSYGLRLNGDYSSMEKIGMFQQGNRTAGQMLSVNADSARLHDCYFLGSSGDSGGALVTVSNARCTIQSCRVSSYVTSLELTIASGDVVVNACQVYVTDSGSGNAGIINAGARNYITNNTIIGTTSPLRAVYLTTASAATILGNVISGFDAGVEAAADCLRFRIADNSIGATTGILVNTGGSDYYIISGNDLTGSTTAITDNGSGTNKRIFGNLPVTADQADPFTAYILKSLVDAKGDLLVASAADTVARLAVGTNDYVLTADSTQATGVKWAAAASGGALKAPQTITTLSAPWMLGDLFDSPALVANTNFGTANLAVFFPLVVFESTTVKRLGWLNGDSVAGNIHMALYDSAFARLVQSGAVAQSGASVWQFSDIADTALAAGRYWVAIGSDSALSRFSYFTAIAALMRGAGCAEQTSAVSAGSLPATATFAAYTRTQGIMLALEIGTIS